MKTTSAAISVGLLLLSFLYQTTYSQCYRKQVMVLVKKDSSEVVVFNKGNRIEFTTRFNSIAGNIKCIQESAIQVDCNWILLNDVELITDPNQPFKLQDAIAWPLLGVV